MLWNCPPSVRSSRSMKAADTIPGRRVKRLPNVLDTIPSMMKYADPAPDIVVLFDDVLTTGSHFKGIEIVQGARFPGVTVFGLFLARAVRPPNDETFDLDF